MQDRHVSIVDDREFKNCRGAVAPTGMIYGKRGVNRFTKTQKTVLSSMK